MSIRARIHATFSMIQQCHFPQSALYHLWRPFWCWLRLSTSICNRFSFIATVSARKMIPFQQNTRQKKLLQDFTEPRINLIRNQLKISQDSAWSRAKLTRENEALISMETSNHKDRSAPSLYGLELKTRIYFCIFVVYLKNLCNGRKSRRRCSTRKRRIWLQKTPQLPFDPCKSTECQLQNILAEFSMQRINVYNV